MQNCKRHSPGLQRFNRRSKGRKIILMYFDKAPPAVLHPGTYPGTVSCNFLLLICQPGLLSWKRTSLWIPRTDSALNTGELQQAVCWLNTWMTKYEYAKRIKYSPNSTRPALLTSAHCYKSQPSRYQIKLRKDPSWFLPLPTPLSPIWALSFPTPNTPHLTPRKNVQDALLRQLLMKWDLPV